MSNRLIAIPVQFDGERIEVPRELKGRKPGRVFVVVEEGAESGHSWRDVVDRVKNPVSVQELDKWLEQVRGEWDDQ